jgi:hypothetical protein
MDYRIAHRKRSYTVEERTTIVKGFWLWKKSVEVYQRASDNSARPEYRHPLLFMPPLPPYRKLQEAIAVVYNQHKNGCSYVKTEIEGDITYYYYEKNQIEA